MNQPPTYRTGEPILEGDEVLLDDEECTVEQIIVEGCPQWDEYWSRLGEGVMLVGPTIGRMFNDFNDEDLVFVRRKEARSWGNDDKECPI